MVQEMVILEEEPVEVRIRTLATRVHDNRTEMEWVQLELNLKITKLQLRAQPSTLPEVKEQRETTITEAVETVASVVVDCR